MTHSSGPDEVPHYSNINLPGHNDTCHIWHLTLFWGPSWLKYNSCSLSYPTQTNKLIIYDVASFVYWLGVTCVCEIMKTIVITYSHKVNWLIIKADVNSFNRFIIHTNNGKRKKNLWVYWVYIRRHLSLWLIWAIKYVTLNIKLCNWIWNSYNGILHYVSCYFGLDYGIPHGT